MVETTSTITGWAWPRMALICPLVKSSTARPEASYTYDPAARSATNGRNSPAPLYRIK